MSLVQCVSGSILRCHFITKSDGSDDHYIQTDEISSPPPELEDYEVVNNWNHSARIVGSWVFAMRSRLDYRIFFVKRRDRATFIRIEWPTYSNLKTRQRGCYSPRLWVKTINYLITTPTHYRPAINTTWHPSVDRNGHFLFVYQHSTVNHQEN